MSFPTVISWLARILVGGLFVLAGVMKILDPLHFAGEIQDYRIVPSEITHAMAFTLPWLEVLVGAALIVGLWRAEARFLIFVMLVVFTVAKVAGELRGLRISCGCFGSLLGPLEQALSGVNGIILNLFLLGLIVADFVSSRRSTPPRISVERLDDPRPVAESARRGSA